MAFEYPANFDITPFLDINYDQNVVRTVQTPMGLTETYLVHFPTDGRI